MKGIVIILIVIFISMSWLTGCGCRQDTQTGSLPSRTEAQDYCRDYCYEDSKCGDWDYDYNDVTWVYWCYCYD